MCKVVRNPPGGQHFVCSLKNSTGNSISLNQFCLGSEESCCDNFILLRCDEIDNKPLTKPRVSALYIYIYIYQN